MAEALPSARPPWALTCWVDDTHIFTEVPALSGPPLIQKYPLTEGGLSRALDFLRVFHRKAQPKGGTYKITTQAIINKPKKSLKIDSEQREAARDVLKKLGII